MKIPSSSRSLSEFGETCYNKNHYTKQRTNLPDTTDAIPMFKAESGLLSHVKIRDTENTECVNLIQTTPDYNLFAVISEEVAGT